jgi:cell division protein FtsB
MVTNFKKNIKRNSSRQIIIHIGGILIVIVFVILIIADIKIYKKRKEFTAQVNKLQAQIEEMQKSNEALKEGIVKSDDSQYIEKIAREQLDLQKEGEQVVSFIVPQSTPENIDTSKKSALWAWFDWLKSKF